MLLRDRWGKQQRWDEPYERVAKLTKSNPIACQKPGTNIVASLVTSIVTVAVSCGPFPPPSGFLPHKEGQNH